MKRFLKWFFGIVGILILTVVLIGVAFVNLSPQFGGSANDEQLIAYAATGHFADGVFTNKEVIEMEMDCHSIQAMIKESMNPDPSLVPNKNIEVEMILPESLRNLSDQTSRVTWMGHSSFLIETGGKRILLDPVFGQYAAPHPWLGRVRFNKDMPIKIKDMPDIDAVIISHDHYDHLDYESICELRDKTTKFFVPLGVGNHLRRWDIAEDKIDEMDWWQETMFEGLKIILTPSRHMSGRGVTDQKATLWGSWIIQSQNKNIYFSGDGGYGEHFKEIGDKYGPFDLGLMECGQYNKLWKDVHMMPEQTVMAAQDVKAQLVIPIHWASFALATHSWTDPIERVTKAAAASQLPLTTPKIGQVVELTDSMVVAPNPWWNRN
ncbi:MAG: MBL fold metallo-hydrolase [Bacteroidota bacterium]